jgi:hypothetical protein
MRRRPPGDINCVVHFDDPPSAPVGAERSGVNTGEGRRALGRALVEIDEEVARQRASGAVPAGFENELDRMFAELTPHEGVGDQALRRGVALVEHSAAIDLQTPVASRRPGGSFIKRVYGSSSRNSHGSHWPWHEPSISSQRTWTDCTRRCRLSDRPFLARSS